jgi:hypothetical protein
MIAAAAAALMMVMAPAVYAGAQAKPEKRQAKWPSGSEQASSRQDSGYTQQLADKVQFGSSAWWEQMRREGRLGGETP